MITIELSDYQADHVSRALKEHIEELEEYLEFMRASKEGRADRIERARRDIEACKEVVSKIRVATNG